MQIKKAKALAKSYRADFRFDFSKRLWTLLLRDRSGNLLCEARYLSPLELEQVSPWRFEQDYLKASETRGK
jgi:hypothetical protein